MDFIFMSCLGTQALTNVSRRSNPINWGMYEPQCTSNCATGIHSMPPIWDVLLAKWHWTCFWHIIAVFHCKNHVSCPDY